MASAQHRTRRRLFAESLPVGQRLGQGKGGQLNAAECGAAHNEAVYSLFIVHARAAWIWYGCMNGGTGSAAASGNLCGLHLEPRDRRARASGCHRPGCLFGLSRGGDERKRRGHASNSSARSETRRPWSPPRGMPCLFHHAPIRAGVSRMGRALRSRSNGAHGVSSGGRVRGVHAWGL